MKDETLLPCPFCGGSAYHEQNECGHFIACEQCGCGTDDWTKVDLAITSWNKRAASAPKKANAVMPDFEGVAMTQRECFQAGLEAGKAMQVQDGWIKCSDRMPGEHGDTVLVWCKSCVQRGYYTGDGFWIIEGRWVKTQSITHWMPLPAAPQPEEKQ